ncbi:MAG TPA: hypothetical protein VK684_06285 [Edaphobacter sp.]|nr:hypothetical protein [Edaphobacter sp.]
MFVAGEADGGDPGGALMDQNTEEEQMQYGRRGGMLRAARRRCDWFAYRLDVCFLLMLVSGVLLRQNSSRLFVIS